MARPALTFANAGGGVPFRVSITQDVELASVTAVWDGGGASAAFLACLSIYSQDGVLLSRTFPNQTFAVADDGTVTYAPFFVLDQ